MYELFGNFKIESVIVVRIFGGLGNQLFQYAFGQYLQRKSGFDVKYDFQYFTDDDFRKPNIKKFNYEIFEARKNISKKHIKFKSFTINKLFNNIFNNKTFKCEPLENNHVINLNDYYHGYWQNKRFCLVVMDSLLENFNIKNQSISLQNHLKILSNNNVNVSVHIRRTDYLSKKNSAIFTQLDKQYFLSAIDRMEILLKDISLTFIVFSDDILWTKKLFSHKKNIIFSEGLEDYEDLFLMSKCNHHILSNSTFSWWGATLNRNKDKKIICPSDWFNGDKQRMNDLILKEWILC